MPAQGSKQHALPILGIELDARIEYSPEVQTTAHI